MRSAMNLMGNLATARWFETCVLQREGSRCAIACRVRKVPLSINPGITGSRGTQSRIAPGYKAQVLPLPH